MAPTRKPPTWLQETIYDPKRQRTVSLVKQSVDELVKQRERGEKTRISLNTIVAMSRQIDPEKKGISHTAILENQEANAYYKRFRTASKLKRRQSPSTPRSDMLPVKKDRDLDRIRRRYLQLSREELTNRLLHSEQQYAELHERWLTMQDKVLEWQLRAELAEKRLLQLKAGNVQ